MWNLEKWYWWTYLQGRNTDSDIQNRLMDTAREGESGAEYHWNILYVKQMKWSESHSVMSNSLWPYGLYSPWDSPGQNTGVGTLSLLQGIFWTQGLSPGLPCCRWIPYCLNHQWSPRVLEWVAYPFSRELPNPGIKPRPLTLQADSSPAESGC